MGRVEQTSGKAWHGPADLSASAFAQWDKRYFYFACDVVDDVFVQNNAASEMWRGDSVQFALSTRHDTPFMQAGYGKGDCEFGLALLKTGPTLIRFAGPNTGANGTVPGRTMRGSARGESYVLRGRYSLVTNHRRDA